MRIMIARNIALVCFAVCAPATVSAQVVISEIMYDLSEGSDTGREWIEVHNTGGEAVNFTEWKLFEQDSNHGLKAIGGETLAPDGYAIIASDAAKFAADWPSYSGLVFDSNFSLNNSGETLVLRCCGKELSDSDSVTYNNTGGGTGDGQALHRDGSSLTAGKPSPGNGTIESLPPPPPPEEEEDMPEPVVQKQKTTPKTEVVQKTETTQKKEQKVAAEQESEIVSESEPATVVVQEEKPTAPKQSKKQKAPPPEVGEDSEEEAVEEETETQVAAVETAVPKSADNSWLWWSGAVGIALLGAGGAYMAGRSGRKKWEIEEID